MQLMTRLGPSHSCGIFSFNIPPEKQPFKRVDSFRHCHQSTQSKGKFFSIHGDDRPASPDAQIFFESSRGVSLS
jgi:hypothetical protein